jgi:hypothetical protein
VCLGVGFLLGVAETILKPAVDLTNAFSSSTSDATPSDDANPSVRSPSVRTADMSVSVSDRSGSSSRRRRCGGWCHKWRRRCAGAVSCTRHGLDWAADPHLGGSRLSNISVVLTAVLSLLSREVPRLVMSWMCCGWCVRRTNDEGEDAAESVLTRAMRHASDEHLRHHLQKHSPRAAPADDERSAALHASRERVLSLLESRYQRATRAVHVRPADFVRAAPRRPDSSHPIHRISSHIIA